MDNQKKHHETHYIHRISYTAQERIVGVFVLSAIVLLVFLLFTTIKSQNIFEDQFTIYGRIKSAEGLNAETIVEISGIEVGKVSAIDITDDNHIQLTMRIFTRFHKLLRSDSEVKVSSLNVAMLGKSMIVITAGSADKDLIPEGTIFNIRESNSVEDIIGEATAMLDDVNVLIQDVSKVVNTVDVDKISSAIESFNQLTTNLNLLSQHINSGQGAVGTLIYDNDIKNDISESVTNLKETTESLKKLVTMLSADADQVPEVLSNINSIIKETEKTIEATQRVWPISTAMPDKNSKNNVLVNPQPAND
ncbi:MAG: hypothetical protein DIZ80_07980 [endosymbiont of Galathealinum brachiosum]|uniref:Mce/MlaD domain-containing protein n=1 Tax=endosymbiont of Galathealinum brachiosum TaxID=2200906 RepID=A0A370DGP2_9GAMM|nr:MAG: hypothetical protein DIZ80_07980 [endosymbiont of Galathealinum brachiosum]